MYHQTQEEPFYRISPACKAAWDADRAVDEALCQSLSVTTEIHLAPPIPFPSQLLRLWQWQDTIDSL